MPELPEVETVVRELHKKLKGRIIKSVEVRAPKLIGIGPAGLGNKRQEMADTAQTFSKLLRGKKILSVTRRAKLLIFSLVLTPPQLRPAVAKAMADKQGSVGQVSLPLTEVRKKTVATYVPVLSRSPGELVFDSEGKALAWSRREGVKKEGSLIMLVHLKMTGQFIFEDVSLRQKTGSKYRILNKLTAPLVQLPGKHTHVIFRFTDGATLYFNDVRKFAYLKLVRDDELDQVAELNEYGPEPLSKECNLLLFLTAVKKRYKVRIKQVLMDNRVVVGIGNIYSDEILFQAKVRPDRAVGSLSKKELQAVYDSIRPVLLQGIKSKGSSVGDFVRTDGTWGSMGKFHYVYGRKGQLCKLCGTLIKSMKLGGRTASFCPKCQK